MVNVERIVRKNQKHTYKQNYIHKLKQTLISMVIKYLLLAVIGIVGAFEDKTIVQYLVDNGFNTLAGAVTQTGLDSTLSSQGKCKLV